MAELRIWQIDAMDSAILAYQREVNRSSKRG